MLKSMKLPIKHVFPWLFAMLLMMPAWALAHESGTDANDIGGFSFGRGDYGKLGHGVTDRQPTPKKIEGLPEIQAIAAGSYHSLVLT